MGMGDVRARFSALQADDGSVAAVIRDACSEAAEKINAAVQGETTELQAVLQFLEQAAHVGLRAFSSVPVAKQPEQGTEEPANTGGQDGGEEPAPKTGTRSRAKAKAADKS